jgi:hypothetical protein
MTGEECILGGAVVLGIIPKLQWPCIMSIFDGF